MPFRTEISLIAGIAILGLYALGFTLNSPAAHSRSSLQKQAPSAMSSDTLTIRYDAAGKSPIFISGKIIENSSESPALKKTDAAARKRQLCRSYLSQIRHALRIARPEEELSIIDEVNNSTTETAHFKIRQNYRGIPVLGAEATIHLRGDQAEFIGRTIATPDLRTTAAISAPQAVEQVLSDLRTSGVAVRELSADEQMILDYGKPSVELVVFPSLQTGSPARLAYQILVRPNMLDWYEYVVDALNAEILLKYNRTCDAGDTTATARDLGGKDRLIHTYHSDKFYLIDASRPMFNASKSQIPNKLTGAIVTYDYLNKYPAVSAFNLITSTQNTWDAKAVSAQYNATVAYEYYRNTHGRNSINGTGGSILSFINVADQSGAPLDNAYWNGRGMYYGNGQTVFKSLPAALDVAGHELTHGVVEATAALRYIGQSGALNESFADIFGCMIERDNWTMGESVMRTGIYPSNVLRDLSNPHNGAAKNKKGWQPQSMSEYQTLPNTSTGDNGGVHVNSSIPNYAYYLFAIIVGKETAERVFYRTLTTYLSASSQFADLRIGSRLACEELYGAQSTEAKALAEAFDSVGILSNTQPFEHVADLPANPGKESVLLTAAPPAADGTTLYIADSAFGSLKSISKRPVKFRPSISDDGSKILFVSGDKKLIALTLNGATTEETIIDSSKIWSLCAISRDGLRFAAVRDKKDTAIYIGSISGGPMRKFNLNGPAGDNTHSVTGAVNATALEWNFTSDEVIYDVFNSLAGPGGTSLAFWDIGFLRSWDAVPDSFGDGEVDKLFNNLGDGISVGNPTFSKNSPNIMAYENIDDLTYTITVMSMNMENRKTVAVASAKFPGYPSYSRLDDKIAFSTISGADTVVSVQKIKADKQTPDGSPAIAIRKMKWAVYFATGTRPLTPTGTRQPVALRPTPAAKPGLTVLSCNSGLRAMITGAGQTTVRISIVRADGKLVYREVVFAGAERVPYFWNGKTAAGTTVANGIYFLQMTTPRGAVVKKLCFY